MKREYVTLYDVRVVDGCLLRWYLKDYLNICFVDLYKGLKRLNFKCCVEFLDDFNKLNDILRFCVQFNILTKRVYDDLILNFEKEVKDMILTGRFVLISVDSKTSNGKVYYNAYIESEDGKVMRVGVDGALVVHLNQKYRKYNGFFEINVYNNNLYMKLKDAKLEVED